MQIDIGCTMLAENREKQQELSKRKKKLLQGEEQRLNGEGMSIDEVRAKLK